MNIDPTKTRIISPSHCIEVGDSSWDPNETSIRCRYDSPTTGRFSPHVADLVLVRPLRASLMKKALCIYCGNSPGVTRDHIPPQCFFEEPCPNINRITVPCCESCKLADEPNDAKARNLIISTMQAE